MSKVAPLQHTTTNDNNVVDDDTTRRWIPSSMMMAHKQHPWDTVAVVYDSLDMTFCGHRIRWTPVPPLACPICNAKVVLVADPLLLLPDSATDRKVFFKYNKQIFHLSMKHSTKRSWWDRVEWTAQDRIAHALGMNAKLGMKVLCKGKVLHPNPNCTPMEVSNQLLDASERDWEQRKASLVVMGTREGQGLHEPKQGLFYAIVTLGISIVLRMVTMVWTTRKSRRVRRQKAVNEGKSNRAREDLSVGLQEAAVDKGTSTSGRDELSVGLPETAVHEVPFKNASLDTIRRMIGFPSRNAIVSANRTQLINSLRALIHGEFYRNPNFRPEPGLSNTIPICTSGSKPVLKKRLSWFLFPTPGKTAEHPLVVD